MELGLVLKLQPCGLIPTDLLYSDRNYSGSFFPVYSMYCYGMSTLVFLLVAAACAASGHGCGGEPAGPGSKPVGALPLLKLLQRVGRRERLACPVPAPHGDALR